MCRGGDGAEHYIPWARLFDSANRTNRSRQRASPASGSLAVPTMRPHRVATMGQYGSIRGAGAASSLLDSRSAHLW